MRQATLILPIHNDHVLLGMKKRRFGAGRWNGFGGKIKEGETLTQAAVREFEEETTISINENVLLPIGELNFYFPSKPEWDQQVIVYLCHIEDDPQETEEMTPQWFLIDELPFDHMWPADRYWMPYALQKKFVRANITFQGEGASCEKVHIIEPEDKLVRIEPSS